MKENEKSFFKIIYSAGEIEKQISALEEILKDPQDPLFNINCQTEQRKSTGLHIAADKGNHELVKFFLNKDDIKVDSKDEDGQTPLFVAVRNACRERDERAYNQHFETITRLLNAGANCEEKDNEEDTPLQYAEVMDQRKRVFNLLKNNRKSITPAISDENMPQFNIGQSGSLKKSSLMEQNSAQKPGLLQSVYNGAQSVYNYFSPGSAGSTRTIPSETTPLMKKNN